MQTQRGVVHVVRFPGAATHDARDQALPLAAGGVSAAALLPALRPAARCFVRERAAGFGATLKAASSTPACADVSVYLKWSLPALPPLPVVVSAAAGILLRGIGL